MGGVAGQLPETEAEVEGTGPRVARRVGLDADRVGSRQKHEGRHGVGHCAELGPAVEGCRGPAHRPFLIRLS